MDRKLFNVIVIDPEGDGKIVARADDIIATDWQTAEKKAINTGLDLPKDLEDYDFLIQEVNSYGTIRPKSKK